MEIRPSNLLGVNKDRTAKGIHRTDSQQISHDRFTRETVNSENIINPNITGNTGKISSKQNDNEIQTGTENSISTAKTTMGNSLDISVNTASPGIMSPTVGAAVEMSLKELNPSMHRAFDIIAADAGNSGEAYKNFLSFQNVLDKDMNPAEMADFFVYGYNFHDGDGKEKESLIRTSLKIYNEFISDDKGTYKGTSREERAECFKLLLEAIPPTKKDSPFCMGDAVRPLYHINEALTSGTLDQYAISCIGRDFGYGYEDISFTPDKGQVISVVDGTKKFIHLLDIIQHAENRESPDFTLNDDDKGFHSLSIIRGVFHYDPDRTKEFEGLLGIVGDPWIALGITKNLDNINTELRNDGKEHLLSDIRKTDLSRGKCSQVTNSVISIYEIMKPGEDFDQIKSESGKVLEQIKKFTADKTNPDLLNFYGTKRLKMVGKYREEDETITDSFNRYKQFATKMASQGVGIETIDKIYESTGKNRDEFTKKIPGATTYKEMINEVGDVLENVLGKEWLGKKFPTELSSDLIELAMQKMEAGESLKDKCSELVHDYIALGDFTKTEELKKMLDQGFDNHEFGDADKKDVMEDIKRNIELRRIMGDSPDDALTNAYDNVKNSIQDANEAKEAKGKRAEISMNDDFILIGGVRIDKKKRK